MLKVIWEIIKEVFSKKIVDTSMPEQKTDNPSIPSPTISYETLATHLSVSHETEPKLLTVARENLGKHLTLNESVNPEVGCAESQSALFKLAGIPVPHLGIAGTNAMLQWLIHNPLFEELQSPEAGCVVIAGTGTGKGIIKGHVGTLGAFNVAFPNDYGLCSNDSNTGLWLELWRLSKFVHYYQDYGGMKVRYFRLK